MQYRRFASILSLVIIMTLLSVPVFATGNSPSIILGDEYVSVDLLDGASNFTVNGQSVDALGAVGVAGDTIDYAFDLSIATYVDYIVVNFYCEGSVIPDSVSAAPFQSDFSESPVSSLGGGIYQSTILFNGIIPQGLVIRFDFGATVYTEISIQSVTGYINKTVVDDNALRIDYRPFVSTSTAGDWSTLTNQSLPWGRSFTGYKDPNSGYVNTLRSGIDLQVSFDFVPVRWASKVEFTFAFPYRFVQDPDTLQWYSSDEWFEFGVFIDKTQSAEGSFYPDVTYTKNIEYADNSVSDYAPWMVYKFSVDLSGVDLAYSKIYFNCRFYGFGSQMPSTQSTPVTTECTLSALTYHVDSAPSVSWISSILSSISRGFSNLIDVITSIFTSDEVAGSVDSLHDSMTTVDDFVGSHESVVDNYVPDMVLNVNNAIFTNAGAFGFIGSTMTNFANKMQGLDIVLTLPIVIGIFCALCQRLPGATSSIRRISKDD